jgi:Ca-activated chloride channel family protein
MKINALLDVNVVAHESEDEVAVLLELEAPVALADTTRPSASLQVVLDRSGSMAGAPLEGAKKALVSLVRRLEPSDNFGLVAFDDSAQLVVAAGPLTDKDAAIRGIEGVHAGGMTDLSAGYLRGLREIRRVATIGGTVLVVSDGHVNTGIVDIDEFASITSKAYRDGLVTSTLGYGRHYDERLLSAIAKAGSGNHVFADDPDAAGAAIAGEVDGLLNKVVQALTLTVKFERSVQFLKLYNDLPTQQIADGSIVVELGDLYGEETRKLVLKFSIPAMAALGLARIATLELAYVELPGLVEQVVSLPISVNVVPGDEAAGRVPHPTVRSEVMFQEAQDIKKQASEAFERHDLEMGKRLLGSTRDRLSESLAAAPEALQPEIRAELDFVARMEARTDRAGSAFMSKTSYQSHHDSNRKRGRVFRPEDEADPQS